MFFFKKEEAQAVVFSYCIVPNGKGEADALIRANLLIATVEAAKRYV